MKQIGQDALMAAGRQLAALALPRPRPRRRSSSSPSPTSRPGRSRAAIRWSACPSPARPPPNIAPICSGTCAPGLNVAALQCQFSPFLRAVANYNGILAHHSLELATAYTTLNNYFRVDRRPQGPEAVRRLFDQTYNNFSTLQAQLGFCQTARESPRRRWRRPRASSTRRRGADARAQGTASSPPRGQLAFIRTPIRLAPIQLLRRRRDCSTPARAAKRRNVRASER